jgi:uncharacterized protein YegP (UPF0339 family)
LLSDGRERISRLVGQLALTGAAAKQLKIDSPRATIALSLASQTSQGVFVMWKRISLVALIAIIAVPAASKQVFGARADKLKFEVYQDNAKEFRWRLKAADGGILATSGQGYKAKGDCKHGVERIMKDADKLKFEVYDDNKRESRFRIIATNGQTIGSSSQSYKTKAECDHAVDLIKKGAKEAEVSDMT